MASRPHLSADAVLGRYRLLRHLAVGGMGEVWEAQSLESRGERVALKILSPSADNGLSAQRKLLDEARIGLSLEHPNVVRTLDVGMDDDRLFVALELLHGRTLSTLIHPEERMPLGLAVRLGLDALAGLAFCHAVRAGDGLGRVVHRDIKPSNLFLTTDGTLKLIDFGIAIAEQLDSTRTRTGAFRGSLHYAAPEQVRNEEVDGRTDLYSLAVVLYELLTGRRAFGQLKDVAVINAILHTPVEPLRSVRDDVPESLDDAIGWALSKDPADRPSDAEVFAAALTKAIPANQLWDRSAVATWVARRRPLVRSFALETADVQVGTGRIQPAEAPAPEPGSAPSSRGTADAQPILRRARPRQSRWKLGAAAAVVLGTVVAVLAWTGRREDPQGSSGGASEAAVAGSAMAPSSATGAPVRSPADSSLVPQQSPATGPAGPPSAAAGAPSIPAAANAAPPVPPVAAEAPSRPAPGASHPDPLPRPTPQRSVASDSVRSATPAAGVPPSAGPAPSKRSTSRPARPARAEAADQTGLLSVDSRPKWSRIFVDGAEVGSTPLYRHSLASGRHRVEAVRPDGPRQVRTVDIARGVHRKLVFEW